MDKKIKTTELTIFGIVQGVGFRWATIQVAKEMGISGWVQNKPDSSVKIIAQGKPIPLAQFIMKIKNSPTPYAHIRSVSTKYITNPTLKGFNVKY